ncbi:haloacid dehalogenase type II [Leucobacter tenebrionis]|uniref:haloacid dehalogenase type II n=1 Tax=Leucobacter tenebrionis TaxID=2873270 RepID=UPI001CA621B4|nr:haloacid dehalogenase type II [Leucobacter tenebrionis]QZY50741.1 haloacid dehalogenase type II [Leucobacter tenebrionis]
MSESPAPLSPKFISFDMLGTLIKLEWRETAAELVRDVVGEEAAPRFARDFSIFRDAEVIGAYKVYTRVIRDSWQRTCNKWRIQFKQSDVDALIDALGTWGPHPDVVEPLQRLAAEYPLVIYTNHCDALVMRNVEKLGVDFHRVFTAEQGRAYKPNYAAFHYMFDQLDAQPMDLLHVSAHLWFDWLPGQQLGMKNQAYIDRGFDPDIRGVNAWIDTLAGVADRVGA